MARRWRSAPHGTATTRRFTGLRRERCRCGFAQTHPHPTSDGFDLPRVSPVLREFVESGLSDRLQVYPGEPSPSPLHADTRSIHAATSVCTFRSIGESPSYQRTRGGTSASAAPPSSALAHARPAPPTFADGRLGGRTPHGMRFWRGTGLGALHCQGRHRPWDQRVPRRVLDHALPDRALAEADPAQRATLRRGAGAHQSGLAAACPAFDPAAVPLASRRAPGRVFTEATEKRSRGGSASCAPGRCRGRRRTIAPASSACSTHLPLEVECAGQVLRTSSSRSVVHDRPGRDLSLFAPDG